MSNNKDAIYIDYYFTPITPIEYIKVNFAIKKQPEEAEWMDYELK